MTKVGFIDSILCAARGLFRGISSERNLKIQIMLGAIVIFTAFLLNISKIYLITIIIVCFLILILELFNRGFEKLIDLVSPEYSKEFGRVKDIMAGVVLLAFSMEIIVGFLILYEPVIKLLAALSKDIFSMVAVSANILLIVIILLISRIKNKN